MAKISSVYLTPGHLNSLDSLVEVGKLIDSKQIFIGYPSEDGGYCFEVISPDAAFKLAYTDFEL